MKVYRVEFSFNGKTYKGRTEGVNEVDAIENLRKKIVIKSLDYSHDKGSLADKLGKDAQDAIDDLMDILDGKKK